MQINGINYVSGPENWKTSVAQTFTVNAADDGSPDGTAMATESNTAVNGVTASEKSETSKTSTDKLKDLKSKDNKHIKETEPDNTQLKFKVHEGTGEIMVQVIDNDTGKVIREIPPESILNSIAEIWKIAGIKVNKKV